MATMDLSVIHKTRGEATGTQTRVTTDIKTHVPTIKEAFQETDIKENNNKPNSEKTENNNDLGSYRPTSLWQDVMHKGKNKMEAKDSLFKHSTLEAMDLRIHNRSRQSIQRTIFEDAYDFAKNYSYKLVPITFENVDNTIIRKEHNYCDFSLCSESETEEDCSRTIDYSQIKEKNYKKSKAKLGQLTSGGSDCEEWKTNGNGSCVTQEEDCLEVVESENSINRKCLEGNCFAGQALDLSVPLVQEEKTDHCLSECEPRVVDELEESKENGGEFDSDKENLRSTLKKLKVTISRPDDKNKYQPCDILLKDIAKLIPKFIRKDCLELNLLDRTPERELDICKPRPYYVISKSTWQLFQSTKERIILTNKQGQPLQKAGQDGRPTYFIFDQSEMAESFADFCKAIGEIFKYICAGEPEKDPALGKEENSEENFKEDGDGETAVGLEKDKQCGVNGETVEVLAKDYEEKELEQETKNGEEDLPLNENEKNNNSDVPSSVTPCEIKMKESQIEFKVVEEEKEEGEEILDVEVSGNLNESWKNQVDEEKEAGEEILYIDVSGNLNESWENQVDEEKEAGEEILYGEVLGNLYESWKNQVDEEKEAGEEILYIDVSGNLNESWKNQVDEEKEAGEEILYIDVSGNLNESWENQVDEEKEEGEEILYGEVLRNLYESWKNQVDEEKEAGEEILGGECWGNWNVTFKKELEEEGEQGGEEMLDGEFSPNFNISLKEEVEEEGEVAGEEIFDGEFSWELNVNLKNEEEEEAEEKILGGLVLRNIYEIVKKEVREKEEEEKEDEDEEEEEGALKEGERNFNLRRTERREHYKGKKAAFANEKKTGISMKNGQPSHKAGKNKTWKKGRPNQKKISKEKKKGHTKPKSKVKNRLKNLNTANGEKESRSEKVVATFQIRTRSKSTSASKGQNDAKPPASQRSDKPKVSEKVVRKRKLEVSGAYPEKTPKKFKPFPPSQVPVLERKTRTGKTIPEPENKRLKKKSQTSGNKRNNSENSGARGRKRKAEESGGKTESGPNLRSRARAQFAGEKREKGETRKTISRGRKK